jgi:hypothetical protein
MKPLSEKTRNPFVVLRCCTRSYGECRAAVAGCERLFFLVGYAWRAYRCIVVAGPHQLFGRILKRGSFLGRSNIGSSRSSAEGSGTVRASGYGIESG